MSTLHWLFTAVAIVLAAAALLKARRASKRLERLAESYWELHYEVGQLGARAARLEGSPPAGPVAGPVPPASDPQGSFVPLSSLKR